MNIEKFNNLPIIKSLQNREGFDFIPSGVLYREIGGLSIWTKYKERSGSEIKVVTHTVDEAILECPDRDIMICKDSNFDYCSHMEKYDEVSYFSPFHNMFKDFDIPWVMVNVTRNFEVENQEHNTLDSGCLTVSDSGGFQVLTGEVGYLSPDKVAKWYNKNVHYGLVLDLPCTNNVVDLQYKSARAQVINTKRMMDHIHPSRLFNVIHGASFNVDVFNRVRDIVEDDRMDRVCIPGLYFGNLVSGFNTLFDFIGRGKKYKQIHMLGVFNISQTICLAKLASLPGMPYITSDASTHLQGASYHTHFNQRSISGALERNPIGIRTPYGKTPSLKKTFQCCCPVCSTLKYVDILGALEGTPTMYALATHNMIEGTRYLRYMYDLAKSTTFDEYREIARQQVGGRGSTIANEVDAALRFIEVYANEGLEKARKKFASYIVRGELFNTKSISGEDQAQNTVSPQEFNALLDKYMNHDSTEKDAKSMKERVKKAKLARGRSAGAINVGGKKLTKKKQ